MKPLSNRRHVPSLRGRNEESPLWSGRDIRAESDPLDVFLSFPQPPREAAEKEDACWIFQLGAADEMQAQKQLRVGRAIQIRRKINTSYCSLEAGTLLPVVTGGGAVSSHDTVGPSGSGRACEEASATQRRLFCQQASSHTDANLRCPHSNFHSQRSSIVFSSSLSIGTTKLSSYPPSPPTRPTTPPPILPHFFTELCATVPQFAH